MKEKFKYRGEYDNYTLPEMAREKTPENEKKLAEGLKKIDDLAERFHKENESNK